MNQEMLKTKEQILLNNYHGTSQNRIAGLKNHHNSMTDGSNIENHLAQDVMKSITLI